MQKVCNHDLPNQLVALQSLLQLLDLEESHRLSPDGREYLTRLLKVAARTSAMARFLRDLGKLRSHAGKPEAIPLHILAGEIQGALREKHSEKQFQFSWDWSIAAVIGDYRTLTHGLAELLTGLAAEQGNVCRLTGTAEEFVPQGQEEKMARVEFVLSSQGPLDDNNPHIIPQRTRSASLEESMEIILARECLAISDATLELSAEADRVCRCIILLPSR